MIDKLKQQISEKLKKQPVSSRVLLDGLTLVDESSRKSLQYQDSTYLPFYYYLSKFLPSKSLFHIGFDLGFPSCCFVKGSDYIERILGFQRKEEGFYSSRLAISNLKNSKSRNKKLEIDFYQGNIIDRLLTEKLSKKFDLIIITENAPDRIIREYLDVCWEYVNPNGFLVLDYLNANNKLNLVFENFCKSKSRNYAIFETRYKTGIVEK